MALVKITKDGYGQLELNNVAFRRDGRVEAQCALNATDFSASAPAENGMLLMVDNVNREILLPDSSKNFPIALHYSTEHMYDERKNALKDFSLVPGTFYPRLGYLAVGDKFTTNTCCFEDSVISDEDTLDGLLEDLDTPVYGKVASNGYIELTATATGAILRAIALTTMPDGQKAVKFQVIA